jgi:hypothetical protein
MRRLGALPYLLLAPLTFIIICPALSLTVFVGLRFLGDSWQGKSVLLHFDDSVPTAGSGRDFILRYKGSRRDFVLYMFRPGSDPDSCEITEFRRLPGPPP